MANPAIEGLPITGNWGSGTPDGVTSGAPEVFNAVIDTSSTATVAALGTTLATGALITATSTSVTGADATKGVVLPASGIVFIGNAAAAVLKVYPATAAGVINGGSAGANISIAANKGGMFEISGNVVNAVYS